MDTMYSDSYQNMRKNMILHFRHSLLLSVCKIIQMYKNIWGTLTADPHIQNINVQNCSQNSG